MTPPTAERLDPARRVNPYDFITDVKDPRFFAGRRAELATIREELLRLRATPPISPVIGLIGERRVGKTSLAHRVVEFAHQNGILPCRVNLIASTAADAWEFWQETLQGVLTSAFRAGIVQSHEPGMGFIRDAPATSASGAPIPPFAFARLYASRPAIGGPLLPPGVALDNDLGVLLDLISRAGYHGVVLIFDEAHFLVENLDLVQQLRHITRGLSSVGLMFSGEPALTKLFNDQSAPFYLQARTVHLGNFQLHREVADCVLLPLTEQERPLVSPMTIDHLTRLSRGKPNQIRLIAHSIYRRYQRGDQDDLNITTGALDDVLDMIQAQYEADYDLKERVESIRRLRSVDLEVLYLVTRYPSWKTADVIALDEAFRGERASVRAATRRGERLQARRKQFVERGLLEDVPDRYVLLGGEFAALYLRFRYEIQKYGALISRLDLRRGPKTPFGEKVDKLGSCPKSVT